MVKRTLDVLISGTAIVFLFPVLLMLVVSIRLAIGTPVFFRQERPGLNGRPFFMVCNTSSVVVSTMVAYLPGVCMWSSQASQ